MIAPYDRAAIQRYVVEPVKAPSTTRSPFARDRARVLHCAALRRLAGKTQVFVAGESDIPRTRLTHSLEVAQVARELGQTLGCDPDLVEVAGLAHDLGHPPFGHNGEAALDRIGATAGGFEGNAQSFRVLTRLEAKVIDEQTPVSVGLNLTRAALDATTKYPWPRRSDTRKFGVYADDSAIFDWVRSVAPPTPTGSQPAVCLEAQVMDWADDVAYSVHDVDDAIQLGWFDPSLLLDPGERVAVAQRCRELYTPDFAVAELEAALERLRALPCWVRSFAGTVRDLAAVKAMTSELIGRFSTAAEQATRARYGPHPLTRYDAGLVVPRTVRAEVAMMKAVAAHYVMLRPGAEPLYAQQREMLAEVVAAILLAGEATLQPWLQIRWREADDDAGRLRVALDQVASLTDASLTSWHARLCRRGQTPQGHRSPRI